MGSGTPVVQLGIVQTTVWLVPNGATTRPEASNRRIQSSHQKPKLIGHFRTHEVLGQGSNAKRTPCQQEFLGRYGLAA